MELKDKAREYAINVLEEQIATVAQAYSDGYMQAYKEIAALPVEEDGVTYVDLGLPSGTLWNRYILRKNEDSLDHYLLPHAKAQVLSLPTKEQIDELFSICRVNSYSTYIKVVGPNGNEINLPRGSFWVKNNIVTDFKAMTYHSFNKEYSESYTGNRHHVVLVK